MKKPHTKVETERTKGVFISPELHRELKEYAEKTGPSMRWIVERAIRTEMDKEHE